MTVWLAAADVAVAAGLRDALMWAGFHFLKKWYSVLDFFPLWLTNVTEMWNQVWSVWMKGTFWHAGSISFCKNNKNIWKVFSTQHKLVINRSQRFWIFRMSWRMIRKKEWGRWNSFSSMCGCVHVAFIHLKLHFKNQSVKWFGYWSAVGRSHVAAGFLMGVKSGAGLRSLWAGQVCCYWLQTVFFADYRVSL